MNFELLAFLCIKIEIIAPYPGVLITADNVSAIAELLVFLL